MKRLYVYLYAFIIIFSLIFVSAINTNVYGYECLISDCSNFINLKTNSCSNDYCDISGFTANDYCDNESLSNIFRYMASATDTVVADIYDNVGTDTDKSKGDIAFTCGAYYLDADGDNYGTGPPIYGDVTDGYPDGYVSYLLYLGEDSYDGNSAYTSIGPRWTDMDGNPISSTGVGMVILEGQEPSEYTIYNSDDEIVDTLISDVNGIAYWTIPENTENYYFMTNTTGDLKTETLTLDLDVKDQPMALTFISPSCGLYFDEGTELIINISATDSDDLISGTVSINNDVIQTFQNGGITFSKILSLPGNFQIIVEANNTRGQRSRSISSIMVLDKENGEYVDGKYVAACITSPADLSNIDANTVNFDASATRAIKITNSIVSVKVPENGDTFSWYWKFMPENIIREFKDSTDPLAYRFTAEFPISGDNSATLKVEIN